MPHPTPAVRSALEPLPTVRVVRHGDFVHVLYHVDTWSKAGIITREDVVSRVRRRLLEDAMPGEMAIGHYICEGGETPRDDEELREAMRMP